MDLIPICFINFETNPPYSMYISLGVSHIDFLPQVFYIDVDDIAQSIIVHILYMFNDPGLGDYYSLIPHQEFKQGHLFTG